MPPYRRTIVCLANSKKLNERCVAGMEVQEDDVGGWIRPVSGRKGEALNAAERRCDNGTDVQLLDLVEIQFTEHRPHACQQENHLIDPRFRWRHLGVFDARNLVPLATGNGPLWVDGYGQNDRIPLGIADRLRSSLQLIALKAMSFQVTTDVNAKPQVRLLFNLGTVPYSLVLTDPVLHAEYAKRGFGTYRERGAALACISLGEPYKEFRFKLAAAVIFLD